MNAINPTLECIEGFDVSGFSVRTNNQDELHADTAKLPTLWQKFYQEVPTALIRYGVYSLYESDVNGAYTMTAGIKHSELENLQGVFVVSQDYLVFKNQGPMPKAVIDCWQSVWSYFSKPSPYKRSYITDFERYQGTECIEIYIGVIDEKI